MKLSELEQGKSSINYTCFIDSNVFLKLKLDQKRGDEYEAFLNKVRMGLLRAVITGFHMSSLIGLRISKH